MRLLRQVRPQGFPIIVDAEISEDGTVIKNSVTIYPIHPNGTIGEPLFKREAPETEVLDEIINELTKEDDNEFDV